MSGLQTSGFLCLCLEDISDLLREHFLFGGVRFVLGFFFFFSCSFWDCNLYHLIMFLTRSFFIMADTVLFFVPFVATSLSLLYWWSIPFFFFLARATFFTFLHHPSCFDLQICNWKLILPLLTSVSAQGGTCQDYYVSSPNPPVPSALVLYLALFSSLLLSSVLAEVWDVHKTQRIWRLRQLWMNYCQNLHPWCSSLCFDGGKAHAEEEERKYRQVVVYWWKYLKEFF